VNNWAPKKETQAVSKKQAQGSAGNGKRKRCAKKREKSAI